MLSDERQMEILKLLTEQELVSVRELSRRFKTSESTIRRDLQALDKAGRLTKVHGGAASKERRFLTEEKDMNVKHDLHAEEKERIGRYAAQLVKDGDFVYIDGGTTTEAMIRYLNTYEAVYVTNGLFHAQLLVARGFTTIIPGGEIRKRTEAIVGAQTVQQLAQYNFTVGFFGTNGISEEEGYSTPDIVEGGVKRAALSQCKNAYILADHSKFNEVYPITFGSIQSAAVITDKLEDNDFSHYTEVIQTYDLHGDL